MDIVLLVTCRVRKFRVEFLRTFVRDLECRSSVQQCLSCICHLIFTSVLVVMGFVNKRLFSTAVLSLDSTSRTVHSPAHLANRHFPWFRPHVEQVILLTRPSVIVHVDRKK